MSVLEGLSRNDRWRACLLDLDLAHDLAFVLVNAADTMQQLAPFPKDTIYKKVLAPAVCKMLNAWLKPATKFKTPPPVGVLSRAMFGDPWCALNDIDGRDVYEAADAIRAGRPLFVPDLAPVQGRGDVALALPAMDCP